jgi:hypothetical protein
MTEDPRHDSELFSVLEEQRRTRVAEVVESLTRESNEIIVDGDRPAAARSDGDEGAKDQGLRRSGHAQLTGDPFAVLADVAVALSWLRERDRRQRVSSAPRRSVRE